MNDVIDKYPIAKTHFFSHMMNTYGVSETENPCFYDAPEYEQHRAIARFFGYPIAHQEYAEHQRLMNETELYMREYNDVMVKYPDGVPDLLQQLKDMPNAEKAERYPEMFHKSPDIMYSLCHALVSAGKDYNIKMPVLKSIKDSLVDAKIIIPAEIISVMDIPTEEEKFDFTKTEEDAPF